MAENYFVHQQIIPTHYNIVHNAVIEKAGVSFGNAGY